MGIDRAALKTGAREAIRASKTSPYLTAFLYILILYVLQLLRTRLTGVTVDAQQLESALTAGTAADYILAQAQSQMPSAAAWCISALMEIMALMIGVGFVFSMLKVSRREEHVVGNLFDPFGNFFRVLWLEILMYLFIFLWSLLLIVPGIVAAYRYRQAIYLLLDHPEMSAMDCIRESKRLMRGHKQELFVLDLSFLGWYILCLVPFVPIYVYPYVNTVYAAYYDVLVPRETPAAPAPEIE